MLRRSPYRPATEQERRLDNPFRTGTAASCDTPLRGLPGELKVDASDEWVIVSPA